MTFKTFKVSHKLALCSGLFAFFLVSSDSFVKLAYSNTHSETTANTNTSDEVAPDSSKVNKRDRSTEEVSADNQSNSKADLEITRAIRQSVMKDSNLSTYVHNVKIITQDGKVTLKGPVRSEQEKSIIAQKAKMVAGPKNVQDQLEVANSS